MSCPQDIAERVKTLQELGAKFCWSTCDLAPLKALDLHNHCLKSPIENSRLSCGKILSHARDKVTSYREKIGIRLCCFKIGVSSNPLNRFASYLQKGYTSMWLIHVSKSMDLIQMLEAALVSEFGKHVGCQNQLGTGGEGALNKETPPPPPYFVYITGGRADQNRRVG